MFPEDNYMTRTTEFLSVISVRCTVAKMLTQKSWPQSHEEKASKNKSDKEFPSDTGSLNTIVPSNFYHTCKLGLDGIDRLNWLKMAQFRPNPYI